MYIWNDISIKVHGSNTAFIDKVEKYINAVYNPGYKKTADIEVLVTDNRSDFIGVPASARLIKTLEYEDEFIATLHIYNEGKYLWYIYEDMADICIDCNKNKLTIITKDLPIEFEYYNILIFMFHPLGYLFENFRFYRIHSSCCTIGNHSFLATGNSGSGKSTSAFAAQRFGGGIISDDLTYVRNIEGHYLAYSLSGLVKLRDDSLSRFFPDLGLLEPVCNFMDETYFFIRDINLGKKPDNLISGIGILTKTGLQASSYKKVKPVEVVPEMFPSTIHTNIRENASRKFAFITEMLNSISCYRIEFGTDMESYYNIVSEILGETDDD
ncbi:MAG: hypothetical protein JXN10_01530 [Clostridia bacterium]|nr:hypothetical protein [Clostridia bacterium]MBN2882182.1 hypothetical protein [Clostridia bacterium]